MNKMSYEICRTEKLDDCLDMAALNDNNFTKKESDFIDSVNEQYSENKRLSDRQWNEVERIWDKI